MEFTTREFTSETWPDYEKLFSKHGGVQGGCWCMYYHLPHSWAQERKKYGFPKSQWPSHNRMRKKKLVQQGRSHGIIVYSPDGQPVGWCQYGVSEELPRIDRGRFYRKLVLKDQKLTLWRITCFFVDRDHRRMGVASIALKAALASKEEWWWNSGCLSSSFEECGLKVPMVRHDRHVRKGRLQDCGSSWSVGPGAGSCPF